MSTPRSSHPSSDTPPTDESSSLDMLLSRAESEAPTDDDPAADTDTAARPRKARRQKAATKTQPKKDDKAEKQSLLKQLTSLDDEDDDTPLTLRSILGGDILGHRAFRRQLLYIAMLCAMAIVYVANRYACQRETIRREELANRLADRKFKALTIAAELTEFSMSTNILENLPDTTLQTPVQPGYNLYINESQEETEESNDLLDDTSSDSVR